jgi:hypothetical protein
MQIRFVNELIKQKVTLLNLPKLIPVINYSFNNVITNISLSDALNLASGFTKANKSDMNTFKLFGIDKRINDIDYFIYTKKVEDVKTRERYDTQEIIDIYFKSKSGLFSPDSQKAYDYDSVVRENPSNRQTNTKKSDQDRP